MSIGPHAFEGCDRLRGVEFVNTRDWNATSVSSDEGFVEFNSIELQNDFTAARYLNSVYLEYEWRCNEY